MLGVNRDKGHVRPKDRKVQTGRGISGPHSFVYSPERLRLFLVVYKLGNDKSCTRVLALAPAEQAQRKDRKLPGDRKTFSEVG